VYTNRLGFQGYAFIEFEDANRHESFLQARKLEARFEAEDARKSNFNSDARQQGPYLWVATHVDHLLLSHYKKHHSLLTVPRSWEAEAIPPPAENEAPIYELMFAQLHDDYSFSSSYSSNN